MDLIDTIIDDFLNDHKKNIEEISKATEEDKLIKANAKLANRIELVKRILRELVSSNRANAKMELVKVLEQSLNSVLAPHKGI